MSFLIAIQQVLPALLLMLGLGPIVTHCNIYPPEKLGDLVQICYSIIVPLQLIYTSGWMEQTTDDYAYITAMGISQIIALAIALLLCAALELAKPKNQHDYYRMCLVACSCMLSTATKQTSWNYEGVDKLVYLYDMTGYLLMFVPEFFASKSAQTALQGGPKPANINQLAEQLLEPAQPMTVTPAIVIGDDVLTGDHVVHSTAPVAFHVEETKQAKPLRRNTLLQICSLLGMCVLGIPLGEGVKSAPLPYCISQTFHYLDVSSVSIMLFCAGIAFHRQQLRSFFSEWKPLFRLTLTALVLQICKQVILPLIARELYRRMGGSGKLPMGVLSSATGFLWLYFDLQEGAWISIVGLALQPILNLVVQ